MVRRGPRVHIQVLKTAHTVKNSVEELVLMPACRVRQRTAGSSELLFASVTGGISAAGLCESSSRAFSGEYGSSFHTFSRQLFTKFLLLAQSEPGVEASLPRTLFGKRSCAHNTKSSFPHPPTSSLLKALKTTPSTSVHGGGYNAEQ